VTGGAFGPRGNYMVQQILVVAAKTLDFKSDKGDEIKGTQVHYLMTGVSPDKETKGYIPLKAFLKGAPAKNVKEVPGVYQGAFAVSMKDGKPNLTLTDLDFVSEVTLG